MGRYIFQLKNTFSRTPLMIKPLIPSSLYINTIKRYRQGSKEGDQEMRAPSTAEEFKRVAEEKHREAEEVSGEMFDGFDFGDSTSDEENVKKKFVDHNTRVDHDHHHDRDDGR